MYEPKKYIISEREIVRAVKFGLEQSINDSSIIERLRQLRLKKCLSRGGHQYCKALKIREEHPWWEERKKRKGESRCC